MKTIERQIIEKGLNHPGLLSTEELRFVVRISQIPSSAKLSAKQLSWLCSIGREKLMMVFDTPEPVPVIDYRARACA